MRSTSLPLPLQAVLWVTLVLTAVVLLKPEAVDAPAQAVSVRNSTDRANATSNGRASWLRDLGEEWKPSEAEQARTIVSTVEAVPVAPPAPIVEPPKPTAPDPALTYLGRIEQDGHNYVFLGRGAIPQVVEIGGLIDPQWKVEKATSKEVELLYLPLNERRVIAAQ